MATTPERLFSEPRLAVAITMEGATQQGHISEINTAHLEVLAASDRFELKLLQPIQQPNARTTWPVGCTVRGKWSTWLARLRPLLPENRVELSGSLELDATAQLAGQTVEIQNAALRSREFQLSSPALLIDEKIVELSLRGQWCIDRQEWTVAESTLQTPLVALRIKNLAGGTGPQTSGGVSFRADLRGLTQAWRRPDHLPDWRISGTVDGQLSLGHDQSETQARWTVGLEEAQLERRALDDRPGSSYVTPANHSTAWQTVWREPNMRCVGSGRYQIAAQTVQLDQCDLSSTDLLNVNLSGSLRRPQADCEVDLQGLVSYDLAKITQRLQPYLGTAVRASGSSTQSFSLRGALAANQPVPPINPAAEPPRGLVPPGLSGQAGLTWQSIYLRGLQLGAGRVDARLNAGTIDTSPIELPLSRGMLYAVPHLHLNTEPKALTLDAGRVLTDVQITPAMCQDWLKYVAPLVAEATQAEGQFSVFLQNTHVPLERPAAARVNGVLSVKQARIGPSALTQELLLLAKTVKSLIQKRLPPTATAQQTESWLIVPAQDITLRVADESVHHNRIEFVSGDVVIRTRGRVGFDQSLSMVVEVPIQDAWVANDRRLAWLQRQSIQIPVSGSLNKPRLDRRALEELSSQLLRKAAGQALENELHRGLEQLFGPIR